jgi:TonB family protein
LLNEAFRARSAGNEAATRGYYLLAGQVLGGVRSQLDRYREFGLDTADAALPDEATSHLDRLRRLVEHVVAHGRALRDENARNIDAAALLENASSARVLLARSEGERAQWQREVADVRQRLAGSNARTQAALAGNAGGAAPPAATRAVPRPTPAAPAAAVPTPSPTAQPAGSAASPGAPNSAGNSAGAGGAAAAAAVPAEVGSLIARASQTVAPTYPTTARAARVAGRVTVFLLIDEKGAVEAVRRTEGPELLRRAAEDAARRWKFRQTIVDGKPVRVSGFISFNFAL